MPNNIREDGQYIARFDKLCDMMYLLLADGQDIWLDPSDGFILLEGIQRMRDRVEIIKPLKTREQQRRQARKIIAAVAAEHDIDPYDIISYKRQKHIHRARQEAIRKVAHMCPSLTSTDMGRLFNRDHATILYTLGQSKKAAPDLRVVRLIQEERDAA